jgi:hypothetical protein
VDVYLFVALVLYNIIRKQVISCGEAMLMAEGKLSPLFTDAAIALTRNYDLVLLLLLWVYIPCEHWPLFQFPDLYTVDRISWTGDEPISRPLLTHRTI